MIFARNFFNKIDAKILYLGSASVKNQLPLRGGFWCSELEVIKSLWRGGELPQSASLHCRGNISCESRDQEHEQSWPLQLIVNSKPLLFSHQKYCCTLSAYLTSSVQIEVAFQDKWKKQFRHLCSLCITSNNEHIIVMQARDVPLTYNDFSPVIPAFAVNYF
jgi:hypothetical protein